MKINKTKREMCTGNGGYFDNGNYGNGDVNNHI